MVGLLFQKKKNALRLDLRESRDDFFPDRKWKVIPDRVKVIKSGIIESSSREVKSCKDLS